MFIFGSAVHSYANGCPIGIYSLIISSNYIPLVAESKILAYLDLAEVYGIIFVFDFDAAANTFPAN